MNYGVKKNIRVFYSGPNESGLSGLIDSTKDTIKDQARKLAKKGAEAINDTGALIGLLGSKLIKANSKAEIDKIVKEEGDKLNDIQKETINALYETGEIGINTVGGDSTRGGKKFRAIGDAIDKSTKEPHIVVYSNEKYEVVSVSKYRADTNGKPENLNANIIQGILRVATQTGSSRLYDKYLTRNALQDLAIYLQGRQYSSRLIPNGVDVKNMMDALAKEKKDVEKAKIDPLFMTIREKFGKIPEVMRSIELIGRNYGIPINSSGEFQIDSYIKSFFSKEKGKEDTGKDIKELGDKIKLIEGGVNIMIKQISTERDALSKKLGGGKFSLSESKIFGGAKIIVKDPNGKNVDISKASILALTKSQAQEALTQISSKTNGQPLDQQTIDIILLLGLHSKLSDAQGVKAQLKTTQEAIVRKEILEITDPVTEEKTVQINKKVKAQLKVSQQSAEMAQNTKDVQSIVGKITPQNAQEKLKTLNPESQEAANLRQYLAINAESVKQYKIAVNTIGKEDAERIFTQNYQEVTGNKNIKIDSEKAIQSAILTDPESTPGQRAFARLEPGKTVSMQKLMEGEMQSSIASSPEIASMNVTMNTSGGFDIPFLKETNLTKPQVQEYMTNISLYADLGLSQLIPHIPLITAELRNKGINTSIDGSTNTMEQQQVLKEIYGLLFGKKIETNSLGDVERAFVSSAGNPTSMKNAMQHTLKIHHLIGESGQAIAPDTLQKWIRGTQESTPNKADLLANIQ